MRRAVGFALVVGLLAAHPAAAQEADFSANANVMAVLKRMRDGEVTAGRAELVGMAKAGDADAAELLGEILQAGVPGIAQDRAEACRYFEQASHTRADSMHNLALCAERGASGAAPNQPLAAKLYQQAADMGMAKSKCALGNLLIAGSGGLAQDAKRGLSLCREAAQAGVADAQTDLGNFYLMGQIVPKDVVEARRWYEKAAAQNQANAAFVLGQIYWNGDGVAKDNTKAGTFWRIAYDNGRVDAAKFLGDEAFVRSRRFKGQVDTAALKEAIGWYEIAANLAESANRKQAAEYLEVSRGVLAALERQKR